MNVRPIRIRNQPITECNKCPVRDLALFQGIPTEHLDWTQSYRDNQLIVPPKSVLYEEGSKLKYAYTLFNGWMVAYHTSRKGKRKIFRFVLPGDFIGFQSDSEGVVSHSISAITEAIVCTFSRDRLMELFSRQPRLPLRLASMEARDMQLCQQHQAFSCSKNAQESIAFLLMELFYRVRLQMRHHYDPVTNSIDFPLTQEDIGDAVGLTNIHVNRVLREFNKQGLIECRHRKLTILKEDRLSEIGDFDKNYIDKADYLTFANEVSNQ